MTFRKGSNKIAVKNVGVYVNKYDFMAVVCNRELDITNVRLVGEKVVIDYISNWSLAKGSKKLKVLSKKS